MTLRCLTTSTQKMVPALTDAIFVGQLKSVIDELTKLKLMADICDLKYQMQMSQSLSLFLFLVLF